LTMAISQTWQAFLAKLSACEFVLPCWLGDGITIKKSARRFLHLAYSHARGVFELMGMSRM
jgi:hypothetical protein